MSAPPSPSGNDNESTSPAPQAPSQNSPSSSTPTTASRRAPRAPREQYNHEQDLAYRYLRDDLEQPWDTVVVQYEAICLQRGWPIRTKAGIQSRYYRVLQAVLKKSLKEVKALAKHMKEGTKSWGIRYTEPGNKVYSWMGASKYSGEAGEVEFADGSAEALECHEYSEAEDMDLDWFSDEDEEDVGEGPSERRQRRSASDSNSPSSPDEDQTATEGMPDEYLDGTSWSAADGKGKGRAF